MNQHNIDALTDISNFLGDAWAALDDVYKPEGNVEESTRNKWVIQLQFMMQDIANEIHTLEREDEAQAA